MKPWNDYDHTSPWKCPECGEGEKHPSPSQACSCPTMLVIPPGQHIHVDCPVHGKTVWHGRQVIC